MKVENIYSSLYRVRTLNTLVRSKLEPGKKISAQMKFTGGGVILILFVVFIWLPLFLFSTANPAIGNNNVEDVTFQIAVIPVPTQVREREGVESSANAA